MTRGSRRQFLRDAFASLGALVVGSSFVRCDCARRVHDLGNLGEPDARGLRLPEGFTARIVARSGEPVEGTRYAWHVSPDGGATFAAPDGGWIYVSNSEDHRGGASALRFDPTGKLVDAYSILSGTQLNCAGGPTPWGTWLSCEERPRGLVWECDPFGERPAVARHALGRFRHEAVAVDPKRQQLYLTEDISDGRLYRFTPDEVVDGRADLGSGTLHAMRVDEKTGVVEWQRVPDPSASAKPTHRQLSESTAFDGGEGITYHDGVVYFTTKGDNRVWAYDIERGTLAILYDEARADHPLLSGVDNVTTTKSGDVVVAEDGGDMKLVALSPTGKPTAMLQIVGHGGSEITGPAFDPSGTRLYFSSQRGAGGHGRYGITYEVTGPFST